MSDWGKLPSLEEYKKKNKLSSPAQATGSGLSTHSAYKPKDVDAAAISPFATGQQSSISTASRRKIMDFAHPVDQSIIKALDREPVNSIFNKVVQTSIDANYGIALATGIHVTQRVYGQLYDLLVACAQSLDISVPYLMISDTVRGLNACTAGTNQFAFIAISNLLAVVLKPEEMKFVIGHECGHLALGHVVYHTAMNMMGTMGGLLPLVGPIIANTMSYPMNAWGRRSEISADRAGLVCCKDVDVAKRALLRLEVGFLNIDEIDVDAYVKESEKVLDSTTFGKFGEIYSTHPLIPKRIKALDIFSKSQAYARSVGLPITPGMLTDAQLAAETEKIIEVM